EYEDDETEDGLDEDDEDEDDEDEEEEHLAPANSTIVAPVDEPVFPPKGTEPIIPPPSTDITIGARITVRPQTSISLPPKAEVERLLTMTTPSPSPPISLSPPSAGERLARCTAPPAHSPPLSPSLSMPSPVDHRDDIPKSEQPPRKSMVDAEEMSDMQAELLALREQQRGARRPGPEARIPDHQDASGDADSHI
ncbi:hypothetical protein Tco_0963705, partial [Tanacetum coccineum]